MAIGLIKVPFDLFVDDIPNLAIPQNFLFTLFDSFNYFLPVIDSLVTEPKADIILFDFIVGLPSLCMMKSHQ
jgi:hypothetical protein